METIAGIVCVAFLIPLTLAGQYCHTTKNAHEYCRHGCCGLECCALPGWAIGSMAIIGVIITIASIVACVWCYNKNAKMRARRTQVSPVYYGSAVDNPTRGPRPYPVQPPGVMRAAPPAYQVELQPPGALPSAPLSSYRHQTEQESGTNRPPRVVPNAPLPSYRQQPGQGSDTNQRQRTVPSAPLPSYRQHYGRDSGTDYGQFPQVSHDNHALPTKRPF